MVQNAHKFSLKSLILPKILCILHPEGAEPHNKVAIFVDFFDNF